MRLSNAESYASMQIKDVSSGKAHKNNFQKCILVGYKSPIIQQKDDNSGGSAFDYGARKKLTFPKDYTDGQDQTSRQKLVSVLTVNESLVNGKRAEDRLSQVSSFSRANISMAAKPVKTSVNVSQISNFGGGIFYDQVLNNNIGVFNNNNVLDESIVNVLFVIRTSI